MAREINIKKGLDIPLAGKAEGKPESINAGLIGICPDDFPGYTWKCDVVRRVKIRRRSIISTG